MSKIINMNSVLTMPLNEAQVEILQLLASDLSNDEMAQLRQMVISFKFRLVEERARLAAQKRGLTLEQINDFPNQHHRRKIKKEG